MAQTFVFEKAKWKTRTFLSPSKFFFLSETSQRRVSGPELGEYSSCAALPKEQSDLFNATDGGSEVRKSLSPIQGSGVEVGNGLTPQCTIRNEEGRRDAFRGESCPDPWIHLNNKGHICLAQLQMNDVDLQLKRQPKELHVSVCGPSVKSMTRDTLCL